MAFKCEKCDKPATIHLTEIVDGQKIEKHLCEECAASEGLTIKTNLPISQLLEDFVLQTGTARETSDLSCDVCGLTFAEFREQALLGCPHDYVCFQAQLEPLILNIHGELEHVGKRPSRPAGGSEHRTQLIRLRRELKEAVDEEHYERASQLRDEIQRIESEES